ncbi:hypothetical protein [Parafrankia discariae]|uniref:hypothetical protein n=1 Tax=Parafrankia discariae TaxID=365528 RepID=UPI000476E2C4|nr:hypothetical protein [Parafrankia discariae]
MAGYPSQASWDDERADGAGAADSEITNETLATARPSTELETATATAPRQPGPAHWSPTVHPDHPLRHGIDPATWPVGFSPTGEALPETLTDVLLRGSHAIRSSKRAEAQRLERAAAIADHVQAQIEDFLGFCAVEQLIPPVIVRTNGRRAERSRDDVPAWNGTPRLRTSTTGRAAGRSGEDDSRRDPHQDEDDTDPDTTDPLAAGRQTTHPRPAGRHARRSGTAPARRRLLRRERLHAWPLLYWRCESFPAPGRSLHLFVEPDGRTFEGRDDPAPLTVLGREVQVWPVDAPSIVEGMAEVDARRCALHLVHGMAHMLWQAGVGL